MGRAESFTIDVKPQPCEEENRHLREAVSALRAAVRTERGRREGVERECNLLLAEFSRLQTRVQVKYHHNLHDLGCVHANQGSALKTGIMLVLV